MLGGLDAEPLGPRPAGVFVGGEGTLGIATRIAVTLTKEPTGRADDAAVVRPDERRRQHGQRGDRGRDRAGGDGGDGPADHPGGRALRARRLPDRRRRRTPRRGRRPRGGSGDRCRRDRRHRQAPRSDGGAPRRLRRRTAAALEGPQDGLRCDRPDRARLLPPRHRRATGATGRGARADLRDRRTSRADRDERVPRRRRQPASAAAVRRTGARRARAGACRGSRDHHRVTRCRRRAVG